MGATQIYVSRGIGTIVLPWRLRCPAEITHLELLPGRLPELRAWQRQIDPSRACAPLT